MSTVFHVMKEEYDRLIEAEQAYRRQISKMPPGSIRVKHIRKGDYLYLAHRRGAKVVDDYIGPIDSPKAQKVILQVKKRKQYEQLLKEVKHSLKDVKKVLRGKI